MAVIEKQRQTRVRANGWLDGYNFKPQVHDHFDGSSHCIECKGECELTGADMAYTALVRALFEGEAWGNQQIPYAAIKQLERANVNTRRLRERAQLNHDALKSSPDIKSSRLRKSLNATKPQKAKSSQY
jgi:hypothetical protein